MELILADIYEEVSLSNVPSVEDGVQDEQQRTPRILMVRGSRRGRLARTRARPYIPKKKNFFIGADIFMLRAILQHNPWKYESNKGWEAITEEIKKAFPDLQANIRQVRERCVFLLKKFENDELEDINRTGTQQDWSTRAKLLLEVRNTRAATNILVIEGGGDSQENATELQPGTSGEETTTASGEQDAVTALCRPCTPVPCTSPSNPGDSSEESNSRCICQKHPRMNTNDLVTKKAALELQIRKEEHEMRLRHLESEHAVKMRREEAEIEFFQKQLQLEERRLALEEERLAEQRLQRAVWQHLLEK